MNQVVKEILQNNKTIVSRSVNVHDTNQSSGTGTTINGIKRPNYQQLKKEKRLSYAPKNNPGAPSNNPALRGNNTRRQGNVRALTKQFNEESISQLQTVSLAQGKVPNKIPGSNHHQNNNSGNAAKIIGNTRDGGCVWFFPNPAIGLIKSFQRPLTSASVGVVKMPKCLPSYLLLINETLRNNQSVKFHLSWSKEEDIPFTVELYDDDARLLEKIMQDIFQKLNRRSFKQYESYTMVSPSSWLSKQLNVEASIEAIAILEGVPFYTNIVLMDILSKKFATDNFSYDIKENYLLLKGNYHTVSNLVTELKKEAARLISPSMNMI